MQRRHFSYLDLVHVHDGPGGSLGAEPVADPLVQGHPVQLAVVGRRPPVGAADSGDTVSQNTPSRVPSLLVRCACYP